MIQEEDKSVPYSEEGSSIPVREEEEKSVPRIEEEEPGAHGQPMVFDRDAGQGHDEASAEQARDSSSNISCKMQTGSRAGKEKK